MDRKGCKYLGSYPQVQTRKQLQEAVIEAKHGRYRMFEFGGVEEDE